MPWGQSVVGRGGDSDWLSLCVVFYLGLSCYTRDIVVRKSTNVHSPTPIKKNRVKEVSFKCHFWSRGGCVFKTRNGDASCSRRDLGRKLWYHKPRQWRRRWTRWRSRRWTSGSSGRGKGSRRTHTGTRDKWL